MPSTFTTLNMIIPLLLVILIYLWSMSISRALTQIYIFPTSGALKLCYPKSRTRVLPCLYRLVDRYRVDPGFKTRAESTPHKRLLHKAVNNCPSDVLDCSGIQLLSSGTESIIRASSLVSQATTRPG